MQQVSLDLFCTFIPLGLAIFSALIRAVKGTRCSETLRVLISLQSVENISDWQEYQYVRDMPLLTPTITHFTDLVTSALPSITQNLKRLLKGPDRGSFYTNVSVSAPHSEAHRNCYLVANRQRVEIRGWEPSKRTD